MSRAHGRDSEDGCRNRLSERGHRMTNLEIARGNIERRIADFLNYLFENHYGKHIAIVAHKSPQLALDVLLKGRTWEQAIEEDWRTKKEWQPGWEYWIKEKLEIKKKKIYAQEELSEPISEEKKKIYAQVERLRSAEEELQKSEPILKEEKKKEYAAPEKLVKPPILKEKETKMGFHESVVPQVFAGKTKTYRLRDHNLKVGDKLDFENSQTGEIFGSGVITKIERTKVGKINLKDPLHGKTYERVEELIAAFKRHNPLMEVTADTEAFIYIYEFTSAKKKVYAQEELAEPILKKEEKEKVVPKEKEEKKKEYAAVQKKEKPPILEKPKKKIGLFERIKRAVTEKKISEADVKDVLKDMEMSLIESDVALEVTEKIISDLKEALVGKSVRRGKIEKIINETLKKSLLEILSVDGINLIGEIEKKKPYLIIFLGFNGAGKTTTIARMGHLLKEKGLKVVFAAADSWRAAAIEQIEEHGKNLGINVIKHKYGADPAAIIFDAVKHAKAKDIDVILADTAGRSHANTNLMEELKKIVRVNSPDLKILVMDALTGNDCVDQTKMFNDAVGVDGLILTKTDVYEKGGALLSSVHSINKPILYIGKGQEYEDLEEFEAEKIIEGLLE